MLSSGTQKKKAKTKHWSKKNKIPKANKNLKEQMMRCIFTWMLPDSMVYDLLDILEGLTVVLQAVVGQSNVVGQR